MLIQLFSYRVKTKPILFLHLIEKRGVVFFIVQKEKIFLVPPSFIFFL